MAYQASFLRRPWLAIGLGLVILLLPQALYSLFMRPDLQLTPVPRLVENIQRMVDENPDNSRLYVNLARVHAMAYAQKADELKTEKKLPNEAWFGYVPPRIPFGQVLNADEVMQEERELDDEAMEKLRADSEEHLKKAIENYRRALELEPENDTAELGLAWALDQSGQDEEAVELYRKLVAKGWVAEKDMTNAGLDFHSLVAEAGGYLLQKLDPEKDAAEIESINTKIEKVSKILRPITPIAIPLGPSDWQSVYDAQASVRFDADGSGERKEWTWITPEAGWLVYDHLQQGQIRSALQMFGSVSFWCFWENGYQALDALDDDGDGFLRGAELQRLAIWQDANQDGISDMGEVRPVIAHGIVAIDCRSTNQFVDSNCAAHHPRGVVRNDGSTLPTFDVILQPAKSRTGADEGFVDSKLLAPRR